MKYRIRRTSQFKKDYKRSIKRGLQIDKLDKRDSVKSCCLSQKSCLANFARQLFSYFNSALLNNFDCSCCVVPVYDCAEEFAYES